MRRRSAWNVVMVAGFFQRLVLIRFTGILKITQTLPSVANCDGQFREAWRWRSSGPTAEGEVTWQFGLPGMDLTFT